MPINERLHEILIGDIQRIQNYKPPEARDKALNDLMMADTRQTQSVRTAVLRNREFWEEQNEGITKKPDGTADDYDKSDAFIDSTNLEILRQDAALVLFELNKHKIPPANLQKLFNATLAEGRDHVRVLGQHVDIKWGNLPTQFPDSVINKLRVDALNLYLKHLISQSEDRALLGGVNDRSSYESVAPLRLSDAALQLIRDNDLNKLPEDILDAAKERLSVLERQSAEQAFKYHIESLPSTELLKINTATEFKKSLGEFKGIGESLAQPIFATRAIEAQLNSLDAPALLTALKTSTLDNLKENLKVQNVTSYYLNSITEAWGVRQTVLRSYIKKLSDKDELLAWATPTANFKTFLKSKGIVDTADLQDAQKLILQQDARTQLFDLALETNRPALVKALSGLSVDKQMALLNDIPRLDPLKEAKTEKDIRRHLRALDITLDDMAVRAIQEEKQSVWQRKRIINPGIAAILSNFRPLITSGLGKVDFEIAQISPTPQPATHDSHAQRVRKLSDKLDIKEDDKVRFFNAFGLSDTGQAKDPNPIMDGILRQHRHNAHLRTEMANENRLVNSKLVRVFLAVNKQAQLSAAQVKGLQTLFDQSDTVSEYIDTIANHDQLSGAAQPFNTETVRKDLTELLSAELFAEIKKEQRNQVFAEAKPNEEAKTAIVEKINQELSTLKTQRAFFSTIPDDLKAIENIEPIHLYNPMFRARLQEGRGQEREQLFKDLADDCELYIDSLNRELATLEQLRLPDTESTEDTNRKIDAQKLEVNTLLSKYLTFYDKLVNEDQGILPAIKHAIAGDKDYVFYSEGFHKPTVRKKTEAFLHPQPSDLKPEDPDLVEAITPGLPASSTPTELLLEDKLELDEIRDFSYGQGKSRANFTEERLVLPALTITPHSADDVAAQLESRRFKMKSFPPLGANRDDLDRINFSLGMAAEVLASMDGPPTSTKPLKLKGNINSDAMRNFCTALLILGETHPKMKFDSSAIRINGKPFKLESEQGRLWGFSSTSLYHKSFKRDEVKEAKEKFHDEMERKFVPSTEIRTFDSKKLSVLDLIERSVKGSLNKTNKPEVKAMKDQLAQGREKQGSAKPTHKEIDMRPTPKMKEVKKEEGVDYKHSGPGPK